MQSTLPLQLRTPSATLELPRTRTGQAASAFAATAFVALCAHVSLPLYFTPVPLTLQDMAVLLVGLLLGPALGASAMLLYLVEGAAGLPVFNPHGLGGVAQLLGPTGGFLLAYPPAAAAAGAIARACTRLRSQFTAAVLAGAAFSVLLFSFGALWLAHFAHLTPGAAWHLAIAPFLPGAVLKVSASAAIFSSLRRWKRR